jgi:3-hydroxyacyl-CoA dehydrogenase
MVIGVDTENFSAGANLFLIAMWAQNGQFDQIELAMHQLQDIFMRMRYFQKPVVVAPCGTALAGGCEMLMSASRVVADSELYSGGRNCHGFDTGRRGEMMLGANPAMRTKDVEPLPLLQRLFEQIGMAKVSMSAEEARQMGILNPCDRVVMNRDFLLTEARQEVLNMVNTGYRPPLPEKIYAAGRDALSAMKVGIYMMKEGGYITEYEGQMAAQLAYVLTGGPLSSPTWVDEQYILDLERGFAADWQ